jgi:putative ABC transport system permease protein
MMPARRASDIDIGLISIKPGGSADTVRAKIASILPKDVTVLTKQQLLEREKTYWSSNLPIGFLFRASLIVGLIVGAVIVYQILYSGVSEHLPEYATLKAMGFNNLRLFMVILQEAMILSVLGFIPGVLAAASLYAIVRRATSLPIEMTMMRVALVYPMTAAMCAVAGMFAMRKLRSADPADIF